MNIEYYQNVISAFKWPVLIVDRQGKIIYSNRAWDELWQYPGKLKNGQSDKISDFIQPLTDKGVLEKALQSVNGEHELYVYLSGDIKHKKQYILTVSGLEDTDAYYCLALMPHEPVAKEPLKNAIESNEVGVWEWNMTNNWHYLSPELSDKFDLKGTKEEVNRQWENILDTDGTFQYLLDKIEGKQTEIHKNINILDEAGNRLTGTLKGNVLYDSYHSPESLTAIISILYDDDHLLQDKQVTQREHIYGNIPDIYYTVDANGKMSFISESVDKILGYTVEELLYHSPRKFYADPGQRSQLALKLQEKGFVEDFRTELVRKDGSKLWVSANIKVIYDSQGKYNGYEGTVRDITEIVETENKLRESEDRYRQLSDITFEGIIVHQNGIVIDVNKSLCDLVGYNREELIGNNIIEICVPDEWKKVVVEKIKEDYTGTYRIEASKRDGSIFPIELESRITEFNGERVRVTAVRDLTSNILFQNQIKKREQIIHALERSIGQKTGKDFFEAAVLELSKILEAKQVFIGRLMRRNTVNTLAHAYKGKIEQNIEYELKHTPCERVFEKSWCCHTENVQKLFPKDVALQQENIEGYVGVPLYDSGNNKIGILVALFDEKIKEEDFTVSVVQVFSIRSSVELERMYVEEKLIDSKKMLQTILDTIPVRVFWKNSNLEYLGANLRFAEDAGFNSADKVIGKKDEDLAWFNEADLYKLDDQRVLKTGKAKMHYEEPQTNASGRVLWLKTSKIPLLDENGEPYGVLGVYEDITEKKINEKAIEESEKKFRTLAENVPGVIYMCKNERGWPLIYLNDAVETLTGYPKEQFLEGNASIDKLIHPENADYVEKTIEEAIKTRKPFHLEYRLKHKDGSWRWVEEFGVGIFDNFDVSLMEGFIHDVTERKQADSARAESELRFRSLVENIKGVFWIRNINDNKLEYLSPQAEELFGSLPDDIYDDPYKFINLIHPYDQERFLQQWQQATDNIPFNDEYRIITSNGEIRTIWARASIIKDEYKAISREFGYAEDITEKKLAQQEIEKLALVARQTDNAVIITDTDIKIEWANEGFTRITGYEVDEVIGESPGRLLQGKATDFNTVDKIRQAIKNHKTIKTELVNYRKSGEQFWVELNIQPIFDENGKLEKYISIQSDVTDRKESEKFLAESEERHRIISEINFDYVYQVSLVNEQLTLDWVSGAFREITGYTLEEVKALPEEWISITLEDDLPHIKDMIRKYMLTGIPYTYEYRIKAKNGAVKWLRDRTKPVLDKKNERLVKIIGAVQDITESKHTEAENKKLALVAERTDNAVIITNSNRRIEWVNEGFVRITGYSFEEAVGKKPSFLQGAETDNSKVSKIGAKLNEKQQVHAELINYRKNGEKFWVELNIQPILDEQGNVDKYISIQSDITERKFTEERIKRHNLELKKTNEELDNFVYRVSHDLKAPISSAKGLINIAKLEKDANRIATCLEMIDKSMIKLDKFILDILDYSRNSRVPVEPAKIDLEDTVNEILNNLSYLDNARNIEKEVIVNQKSDFYSDHRRITFVLNNILSNAIKFHDAVKAHNYIKFTADIGENEVKIVCEDNGIGIEEDHLDKVFNMFYRATEQMTGSGLGLYIVKEAVEKLRGNVSVDSTIGSGTKFTIVLPNIKPKDDD